MTSSTGLITPTRCTLLVSGAVGTLALLFVVVALATRDPVFALSSSPGISRPSYAAPSGRPEKPLAIVGLT